MCVCIHRDRRGNTIWTSRKKELAKSSRRERDIYMCVCVCVFSQCTFSVISAYCCYVCVCEREKESQRKVEVKREKRVREREIKRNNKRAPRHLENSPMKTQSDGQKTLHLSLSLRCSLFPSFNTFSQSPYFLCLLHQKSPPGYMPFKGEK